MNAAEHITKLWLESQEYFVMGPLCVGQKEIDLLAIQLDHQKTGVASKLHVEVHVSHRPGGPNDGTGVREYAKNKFADAKIESKAKALLGNDYERWLIIGKVLGRKESEWIEQGPKLSPPVRVISFAQVIKDYATYASNNPAPADQLGRFLDILHEFGLLSL